MFPLTLNQLPTQYLQQRRFVLLSGLFLFFLFVLLYTAPWSAVSKMAGRQALVVPALKKHTATVIMAHGLGDRSVLYPTGNSSRHGRG